MIRSVPRFQPTELAAEALFTQRQAAATSADRLPSVIEIGGSVQVLKDLDIRGTLPELYLTETDQADPAGRYRLQVTGDVLKIQRAATANWATATDLISLKSTQMAFDLSSGTIEFWLQGLGGITLFHALSTYASFGIVPADAALTRLTVKPNTDGTFSAVTVNPSAIRVVAATISHSQASPVSYLPTVYLGQVTINSSYAHTFANVQATLHIKGPPIAGTNTTISLPRSLYIETGISEFAGAVYLDLYGTAAAPALAMTTDVNTGLYWPAADELGIATGGAQRIGVTSAALQVKSLYAELDEITAPAAPAADKGRLYLDVSGVKTRLMVIFQSGAAQQIAIEP